MPTTACPICQSEVEKREESPESPDGNSYDCPNCGRYFIDRRALAVLPSLGDTARAVLSHGVWMGQTSSDSFRVRSNHLDAAKEGNLPNPAEQMDLFLLFLGGLQSCSPGRSVTHHNRDLCAKIGALSGDDVAFIARAAEGLGLLDNFGTDVSSGGRLTMSGWEYYGELKKGKAHGRTAFMALPFGNEQVVKMVREVFGPAVEKTGFRLKRLDDDPPAGLIDNRMRVEIMTSRFLIADLTDGNQGAYWEAGLAEGQGKPVIYTCSRPYFDERGTHFDTNHCQTVLWDSDNPEKAAEDLKATIRATLPFEARMPEE